MNRLIMIHWAVRSGVFFEREMQGVVGLDRSGFEGLTKRLVYACNSTVVEEQRREWWSCW